MERQRADWVLPAEVASIPRVRRLIAQRFGDLPDESLEVLLLLASELMTNAVRHGAGPVAVHVTRGDGGVRVEVEDQSPERPVLRATDHEALNGRGLILVDGLSSGWGVSAGAPGKTVWFTLDASH